MSAHRHGRCPERGSGIPWKVPVGLHATTKSAQNEDLQHMEGAPQVCTPAPRVPKIESAISWEVPLGLHTSTKGQTRDPLHTAYNITPRLAESNVHS